MFAWLMSIGGGAVAALATVIIAIGALTGVDAQPPTGHPGAGQYGE